MLRAPPETPFGTAMGAFGAASAASPNAYPADKVPYCSDGFDKPARIVLSDSQQMYLKEGDNPEIYWTAPMTVTLTVGDKSGVYSFHEPGDGAKILYFAAESDDAAEMAGPGGSYLAEATLGGTKVVIFADRIFWPCAATAAAAADKPVKWCADDGRVLLRTGGGPYYLPNGEVAVVFEHAASVRYGDRVFFLCD
jgi:hypothetical protein